MHVLGIRTAAESSDPINEIILILTEAIQWHPGRIEPPALLSPFDGSNSMQAGMYGQGICVFEGVRLDHDRNSTLDDAEWMLVYSHTIS